MVERKNWGKSEVRQGVFRWVCGYCLLAMPPRSDIYRWRDGDDNGEGWWGRGHERSTRLSPEASEGILIMGGGGLLCSSHVNFISLLHDIPFWRYTYLPSSLIHPKNGLSAPHSSQSACGTRHHDISITTLLRLILRGSYYASSKNIMPLFDNFILFYFFNLENTFGKLMI